MDPVQSPRGRQAKPIGKGFAVEESLRAYFARQGFFALRSIPYRMGGEDLTDVDLWMYERPAAISRRRTIVDIKNKKSPQAAERLIWTRGLVSALGVDEGIIATTDNRPAVHRLARSLGIDVINLPDFQKSEHGSLPDNLLTQGELEIALKAADRERGEMLLTIALNDVKASLINNLGFGSANLCLSALKFFCNSAVTAPDGSTRSNISLRGAYISAACCAISLDYAVSTQSLKSQQVRMEFATNGIRYGFGELLSASTRIRATSALLEKYVENGKFLAKQVESGFFKDAADIPAEIIGQFVSRGNNVDVLFDPACVLIEASLLKEVPGYDSLPASAKSLISIFLDFNGFSREKFANILSGMAKTILKSEGDGSLLL
jgi:hypothetical protein